MIGESERSAVSEKTEVVLGVEARGHPAAVAPHAVGGPERAPGADAPPGPPGADEPAVPDRQHRAGQAAPGGGGDIAVLEPRPGRADVALQGRVLLAKGGDDEGRQIGRASCRERV